MQGFFSSFQSILLDVSMWVVLDIKNLRAES